MAGKETVYIRGENGVVKLHDLPLPWGVQDRLDKGQVKLVDAPAAEPETPDVEPETERKLLTRPAVNDPKAAWAAWAKQVDSDLTDDDVNAMTKDDLKARY